MRNFDNIKEDLLNLYNTFMDNPNVIPATFLEGIITLVPKVKNVETISDLRPISLLNMDYKLFAKILAARVQVVMASLIGWGQSACIPGVSYIENLIQLRNLMAASATSRRMKNAIMSIDLEKAFDRVDHRYLWKCLAKFNFPERFIDILKHLYSGATSRVCVNGFLTGSIDIKNSVRQGCPLSMILFVLYTENKTLLQSSNKTFLGSISSN
jgi:hypothetical protein